MKNKFALFSAVAALFVLIAASEDVISCSRNALKICADSLLPSLFPFFVISALLSKLGLPNYLQKLLSPIAAKIFGVSGAGISALFVGLCSGYPMGAAYIAELYCDKTIGRSEAERLLAFCNNSGPAFVIAVMGVTVFKSAKVGLLLYTVHIFSALISGVLLRGKSSSSQLSLHPAPVLSFSQALPQAVKQSVISALNVCGFVVCFTVFTGLLDANGFLSLFSAKLSVLSGYELHWSRAAITGIFELGSAAALMNGLTPLPHNIALAAALLGWGGISVHFQTLALISDTDIKGTLHFAGRLLSAVLSYILAYVFALLFA